LYVQLILLLGTSCIVCLMPLAIYFIYLASLNSRKPATLVSGTWDFGSLLLGLGGFLLLSGPILLSLIDSVFRAYAYTTWNDLRSIGRGEAQRWSLLGTGYLVLMGFTIVHLLRKRQSITAIYNVEPGTLDTSLKASLEASGYQWSNEREWLRIQGPPSSPSFVRIDQYPATAHATLSWEGNWQPVRGQIEASLSRFLVTRARNSSASWFFNTAVAIMAVMLFWLAVLVFLITSIKAV
jgi:hypothetical protein